MVHITYTSSVCCCIYVEHKYLCTAISYYILFNLCSDSSIIYATGARLSILESVAEICLQSELVDKDNPIADTVQTENQVQPLQLCFKWQNANIFEHQCKDKNLHTSTRVVTDMISSEWFAEVEEDVKHYYGDDNIGILNIVLSYDATSLTKVIGSTGRYATPVYVMLGKT